MKFPFQFFGVVIVAAFCSTIAAASEGCVYESKVFPLGSWVTNNFDSFNGVPGIYVQQCLFGQIDGSGPEMFFWSAVHRAEPVELGK